MQLSAHAAGLSSESLKTSLKLAQTHRCRRAAFDMTHNPDPAGENGKGEGGEPEKHVVMHNMSQTQGDGPGMQGRGTHEVGAVKDGVGLSCCTIDDKLAVGLLLGLGLATLGSHGNLLLQKNTKITMCPQQSSGLHLHITHQMPITTESGGMHQHNNSWNIRQYMRSKDCSLHDDTPGGFRYPAHPMTQPAQLPRWIRASSS